MSDSSRPHGLQPTRLLCPWDFPGKSTGVGCHCLLRMPHNLTANQKNHHFEVSSSLILNKNNKLFLRLWDTMESGFYMTTGNDQLSSWTEKLQNTSKVLVAQSYPTLCDPMDSDSPGSSVPGILQARVLEWVAIPFSRGSSWPGIELGLLHCRQILYHLSHQGNPFQSQIIPKKGHGHCVVVYCPSDPLLLYESVETIISETHAQQIDEMHQKVQCLQPALVNRKGPILCNKARLHIAQPRLQKLNKLGYKVLPHLPYSPNLPPSFHFFKHLDKFLQGKQFHT